jgi:small GTP-binding protein
MALSKKICILGMFGVGKTSLVDRVAYDRFSADYKTTIGVRPVPATVASGSPHEQKVILWDIAGESEISRLTRTYLLGAHGFVVVMDGLRADSVQAAQRIVRSCEEEYPHAPRLILANKIDLSAMWEIGLDTVREKFAEPVWGVSAKDGTDVHDAFCALLGITPNTP